MKTEVILIDGKDELNIATRRCLEDRNVLVVTGEPDHVLEHDFSCFDSHVYRLNRLPKTPTVNIGKLYRANQPWYRQGKKY